MKHSLILILFLFSCSFLFAVDTKPIVKDGYVLRTIQQDAELKDWLTGLQAENQKNKQRAIEADQHETDALVALRESQEKATALQKQADKDLARAQEAEKERDASIEAKRKALLALGEWRIGFGVTVAAFLIYTFRKPILALCGIPPL